MLKHHGKSWIIILAVLFFVFSSVSQAKDPPPPEEQTPDLEEWIQLVDDALPKEVITDNNQALVEKMLDPRLGKPLRETFDVKKAIKVIFGRGGATRSPKCRILTTPVGDIDPGECIATRGEASGGGAYLKLSFSKHMSLGNIKYSSRKVATSIDPAKLEPVQISDMEAYEKAVAYLNSTFGLSHVEIPPPPSDAILPVKTIALAWMNQDGNGGNVPVEKIVMLQRGLYIGADKIDWVPGPGRAFVVMDDSEVQEAAIRNWQELQPHPNVSPENAKTRTDLIQEMAEDLFKYSNGPVETINARFVLSTVLSKKGVGLFSPAVQAIVSPVPGDLNEEEQQKVWTSAGFIREYSLVTLKEESDEPPQPTK